MHKMQKLASVEPSLLTSILLYLDFDVCRFGKSIHTDLQNLHRFIHGKRYFVIFTNFMSYVLNMMI